MVGIDGEDLPATFTTADAERRGVTRRSLRRMLDVGSAERVGRGLYRRTDREPVDFDLIEIPFPERGEPQLVPNGARERGSDPEPA